MKKYYKKGERIRQFEVTDGKVLTTICIGGVWVSNPTESAFLADGWSEYEMPTPIPYVPTYEERVVALIRERYDLDSELAILRQRDTKPTEYAEYFAYCEECKSKAKEAV